MATFTLIFQTELLMITVRLKFRPTYAFASLSCACSLAAPVGAHAQTEAGPWYAQIVVGAATQAARRFDFADGASRDSGKTSMRFGALTGAALGYQAGPWRIEGEFIYQSTDMKRAPFGGAGPAGSGNFASTSIAVNALREFDLIGKPSARTYLGIGAVRLTEVDADFEAGNAERSFSGKGSGVQLLAGARYDLGSRWFVDAGVRGLWARRLTLREESGTGQIDARYRPWAVTVALGWRL
jgi:opacity protein-like surface antigen